MVERGVRKFTILFALELIIWNSAMLFQHQTQSYKQNLTNLNYVYRYFSICVCLTTSELFLTLISKKKFEMYTEIRVLPEKCNLRLLSISLKLVPCYQNPV